MGQENRVRLTTTERNQVTATPQDRAKLIADTVYDSVSRQIQEAIKSDPSMAQLSAFVSEAVDGFYINTGAVPTLIPKGDLLAKPISEWFKVVADKRHAMDVKLPEAPPEPEPEASDD